MAEHTSVPTNAYEDSRERSHGDGKFSHDIAGGDLDLVGQKDRQHLPGYSKAGDSSSTLGEQPENAVEDDGISEEDLRTLRRVSDKIPISAWLVVVVELCERFTYYGLSPPFQNYIQV
jgi:hypothetical protein